MLFSTEREHLLKSLQAVIGVVGTKTTMPILSNVLVEKRGEQLRFVGTDLELQITATQPVLSEDLAAEDFAFTVNGHKFQAIINALPEKTQVQIQQDDQKHTLHVKTQSGRFHLQTLETVDFPDITAQEEDESKPVQVCLNQKQLKQALNRVKYAMANDGTRVFLIGSYFKFSPEGLTLVATDGHRLAWTKMALENNGLEKSFILPYKTVIELTKLIPSNVNEEETLTLSIKENWVSFSFPMEGARNLELVSKLVEGTFPDYERVIPRNLAHQLRLDRSTLLKSLQRSAILSDKKASNGVRLLFTFGELKIISRNSENEESEQFIDIEYDKETDVEIGFNLKYLTDVLSNVETSEIEFQFNDANGAGVFVLPEQDDFKYVVMPLRI